MASVGGTVTGTLQVCVTLPNDIGEAEKRWTDVHRLVGWLDLRGGESKYNRFHAKLEESTHLFLCDFHPDVASLAGRDTRLLCKGTVYDVLLIDNPMEMNEQLELYLRKVGAWNG